MLKRKIDRELRNYMQSGSDKILVVEGARQVGKSFSIRQVGSELFAHFVEINLVKDDEGSRLFKNVHTTDDFYFALSMQAGSQLGTYDDTLVFLDEIQHYPQYLTLLKFFREDHRYHFIASGSLLGIALRSTTSIPVGSIIRKKMYQLDFEEFLWANGMGEEAIDTMRQQFHRGESPAETLHDHILSLFKRYLLVGGMPDAVNEYLNSHNIAFVRNVQNGIRDLYAADAAKYENEVQRHLSIRRIYGMIPSQMENRKKRLVAKDIEDKKGARFDSYKEEFEYLISSGIVNAVHAVANPIFPLTESVQKNLLKLYSNDVGLLTAALYHTNLLPVLHDELSVNLGSVYECAVAQELASLDHNLFYYDNRKRGEVDFLIDDYKNTSILPLEVKSGKDYNLHAALDRMIQVKDYRIKRAIVLSNAREIKQEGNILYMPIYYCMFLGMDSTQGEDHQMIF